MNESITPETIFLHAGSALLLTNDGGQIIKANPFAERLFGYEKDGLNQKHLQAIFSTSIIAFLPSAVSAAEQFDTSTYTTRNSAEVIGRKIDGTEFRAEFFCSTIPGALAVVTVTKLCNQEWEQVSSLFEPLIRSPEEPILIHTQNGSILAWSQGAERMFGYSAAEIVGKQISTILPPRLLGEPEVILNKSLNGQQVEGYETTRVTKNGEFIKVSMTVSVIKNSQGEIIGFSESFQDVNAKQFSEKRKDLNETYYRLLFEEANDTIYITDPSARPKFLDINQSGCRLLGYTREELLGMTTFDIIFEEDLVTSPSRMDELRSGKAVRGERRLRRKDGSAVFVELSVKQMEDGNFMAIVRDVDERKAMEAKLFSNERRFRALVENNYDIISLIDESFQPIYRSPSLYRIMGFKEENMKARSEGADIHPEDREHLTEVFKKAAANPAVPLTTTFRRRHKNGHYIWLEGMVTNLLHDPHVRGYVTNFRDITDSKIAIDRVKDRELLFRTMVENNYDIIALLDHKLRTFYRSPSASRIMGWSDDEMKELDGREHIHPDDRELAENFVKESIEKPGKAIAAKFRRKHKNGNYLWMEGTIINLLHQEGIKAFVTNFRDITERKQAEDAQRANEVRFRTLIENNNDIISLMDAQFRITYRSPSAQRIMGWTNEELMQQEATLKVHPDELEDAQRTVKEMLANPGKPIHTLFRNLHKDGHYVWLEGTVINLLHDEHVRSIVYNYRDVTERKEAEEKIIQLNKSLEEKVINRTLQLERTIAELRESDEKFEKVFTSSAAGIAITSVPDLVFTDVNSAFEEMTGFAKEELIGSSSSQLNMSVSFERRDQILAQISDTGSAKNFEMELRTKAGNIISLLVAVEQIILKKKKYNISIIYDITDRKKTEAELIAVNKELEAFSYSVSHDLRAPLRAIHGYAQVLGEDYSEKIGGEGARVIDMVQSNAARMGTLIDDLLAFSRLGRKEVQKREVNLLTLTEDVIKELQRSHPHQAEIKVDVNCKTLADFSLLNQVMVNLISNAIKYSSRVEQPKVEIAAYDTDVETRVTVKDNGAGFDMRYANKLFGVFQRLHSQEEFVGTGVGLAIVQRIITKHGGIIWAEGKVNEGATFTFTLPKLIVI